MKNILFILILVPFAYACKKELTATEYLIMYQEEVTNLNELFNESRDLIAKKELESAEKVRIELFNESTQALKKIEKLESFEEDDFMKAETLSLIRFYKDLSSSEHRELIQILRKEKLELVDDVRVNLLNREFKRMYTEQNNRWTNAKMQFERTNKVSIP